MYSSDHHLYSSDHHHLAVVKRRSILAPLAFAVIGLLLLSPTIGCTVVKIYPADSNNQVKIHRSCGFLLLSLAEQSCFGLESKGIGFVSGIDGMTIGYHDLRAVVGLPENTVVVFSDGNGSKEFIAEQLGIITQK